MGNRRPYTKPEVTSVSFRNERGYAASLIPNPDEMNEQLETFLGSLNPDPSTGFNGDGNEVMTTHETWLQGEDGGFF